MANWHNGRFRAPKGGGSPGAWLFPIIVLSTIIGITIQHPILLVFVAVFVAVLAVAVVKELNKEEE